MPGYRSVVMVGREGELAELRALASRALAREPVTAIVVGEAGVGKTRLVSELLAELAEDGWLCAVGHGVELAGGELPFGATTEVLRSLVRVVGVDGVRRAAGHHTQTLATLVPTLGRPREGAAVDRHEIVAAVLDLLESLARPVCLLLDDLQWMDGATRDLTAYLARVLVDVPVLVLATVRTSPDAAAELPGQLGEIGRTSTVVSLGQLARHEVAAQVAAIPGHRLTGADVTRICEVSDGLPFFVEQLVAGRGRVTGSLRSVVLAGFETLAPHSRRLLAAAAVGEGALVPSYLREVSGLGDAFQPALAELREHGVLRPDHTGDVLRFRHALLREAIDSTLLAEERQALHREWAERLDVALAAASDRRLVMERARHRYAVGGKAAYPAVLAAARVADASDDDEVRARWWGRALELSPPDPVRGSLDRDRVVAKYIEALWAVADLDECERVLSLEAGQDGDWVRALWLDLHEAEVRRAMHLSSPDPAPRAHSATLVERLLALESDFRVPWMLVHLAFHWFVDSGPIDDPQLCARMLEEAIARADPATDADSVVQAHSLLGWCDSSMGDHDQEVARLRQAVAWTDRHRPSASLSARVTLSGALVTAGRYAESVTLAEANLGEIRDSRLRPHLWVAQHLLLAAAHVHSDGWDEAAAALELADTEACGGDIGSYRDLIVTTLRARRGDLSGARAHLEAIPVSATDSESTPIRQGHIVRAFASLEVAAAEDDIPGVRSAVLAVADMHPPPHGPIDVWEAFGSALKTAVERRQDDAGTADFVARTRRELAARPCRGPLLEAVREEATAHLHRVDDTDTADEWAAVARRHAELGRRYDVAWCALFEAECALRDGDRRRARSRLEAGAVIAGELGAAPLQRRLTATARRANIGSGPRPSAENGLTAREMEVLQLLAEGRTNAQIAATLSMSPKTASVHVSRIITKLGVANRTEAAALAHRQGLAIRGT